jgi:hypothetical protein
MTHAQITRRLLKEAHQRQFNGGDWQVVAVDLLPDDWPEAEREECFNTLATAPDPGCDCGFCKKAEWVE